MSDGESVELVVPVTGELVQLDDPHQCARALASIRDVEDVLRDMKAELRESLLEHSRAAGTKTFHFEDMTATISTAAAVIWDQEILAELIEAGLPTERFDELVTAEISYKVNRSVAKSIAGSNDEYAEIIERAQTRITKDPGVTIKRAKRGGGNGEGE